MLSLLNAREKEKLLKKSRLPIGDIDKARREFRIRTVLAQEKDIIVVLEYLNDRHAVADRFPSLRSAVFYDVPGFLEELASGRRAAAGTVLYSPEKYYELLQDIWERLMAPRLIGGRR